MVALISLVLARNYAVIVVRRATPVSGPICSTATPMLVAHWRKNVAAAIATAVAAALAAPLTHKHGTFCTTPRPTAIIIPSPTPAPITAAIVATISAAIVTAVPAAVVVAVARVAVAPGSSAACTVARVAAP
jgi:hypothetical protein